MARLFLTQDPTTWIAIAALVATGVIWLVALATGGKAWSRGERSGPYLVTLGILGTGATALGVLAQLGYLLANQVSYGRTSALAASISPASFVVSPLLLLLSNTGLLACTTGLILVAVLRRRPTQDGR